jgi:hypothetical protein
MRSQEHRSEFNEVSLLGAKIGGQVDLSGVKVSGTLNMESIDIGEYLLMHTPFREPVLRPEFDQPINLTFARIGSSVNLSGAALSSLDLTGATIGGELTLARPLLSLQWRDGGRLVLRNTSVDAIGDTGEEDVWPALLDLDGFDYQRLGGFSNADIATRGSEWFIDWLRKDQPFSPQPYEQLGRVLHEMATPKRRTMYFSLGASGLEVALGRMGTMPPGSACGPFSSLSATAMAGAIFAPSIGSGALSRSAASCACGRGMDRLGVGALGIQPGEPAGASGGLSFTLWHTASINYCRSFNYRSTTMTFGSKLAPGIISIST